ncbi:siderophore-interacting protein [Lentzea sp. JNUCC 0626]|uniref:siderophore-interacting protein n=1 Tax=Lentzea sp. JNUCC 0626 TaxID=3367513 RepID=UPI003748CEB9
MAKRGFTGVMMRGYGAREHEVTVLGTEKITDHFVRMRLHSPTVFEDAMAVPTAWLRFWFPHPADGVSEHQRAYTISSADEATGQFSIDMVLHEPAGPASAWAATVRPGQRIMATSMGSTKFEVPPEPPAGYLLVGDSASLPAINAILGTVPPDVPVEVYLEQHHDADRAIPLTGHPRARIHSVPRLGPASLAAAIEARDWSDWYAWAGPEAGSLKHLRTRLRDEFGFPKSEQYTQAYWYFGLAFGKRRGEPEPVAAPLTPEPAPPPQPRTRSTFATRRPLAAATRRRDTTQPSTSL